MHGAPHKVRDSVWLEQTPGDPYDCPMEPTDPSRTERETNQDRLKPFKGRIATPKTGDSHAPEAIGQLYEDIHSGGWQPNDETSSVRPPAVPAVRLDPVLAMHT